MKDEFAVTIKPLTPLFTGNENGFSEELRPSGVIGSLRWWYEALLRGMGMMACGPAVTDAGNMNCRGKKRCAACQLFGCNGWRGRFILHIEEVQNCCYGYAPLVSARTAENARLYPLGKTGWKDGGGLLGRHRLIFLTEKPYADLLKLLVLLASSWGLGAKVQKGFGIVFIEDKESIFQNLYIDKAALKPAEEKDSAGGERQQALPSADKFFFYRIPWKPEGVEDVKKVLRKQLYKVINEGRPLEEEFDKIFASLPYLPVSPWVRRKIRDLFRDEDNGEKKLRHYLLGIADKKQQKGSCIFVSHLYNKNAFLRDRQAEWELKVWGWLPAMPADMGVTRDEVKDRLRTNLKSEEFWKDAFGLSESPVLVGKIWEKWEPAPEDFLDLRSGIYD